MQGIEVVKLCESEYFASTVQSNGEFRSDVNVRMEAGRSGWRSHKN